MPDVILHRAPEAFQETETALHTFVRPLKRLLRRCREHHEQAHSIGAVLFDQFLRIDSVALGLGHLGAVFQHHALRQQIRKWFTAAGHSLVAHDPLEKS